MTALSLHATIGAELATRTSLAWDEVVELLQQLDKGYRSAIGTRPIRARWASSKVRSAR